MLRYIPLTLATIFLALAGTFAAISLAQQIPAYAIHATTFFLVGVSQLIYHTRQ